MVDNKEAWLNQSKEMLKNLSKFADTIYKDLPQKDKDILDRELKTIDVKDLSPSLDKILKELKDIKINYNS